MYLLAYRESESTSLPPGFTDTKQ